MGAARRIALAAQGFGAPRRSGKVGRRQLRSVLARTGLFQIDSVSAGLGGKPMWLYLLAIACALMAVEWWLYQRRWIS